MTSLKQNNNEMSQDELSFQLPLARFTIIIHFIMEAQEFQLLNWIVKKSSFLNFSKSLFPT